MASVLFLMRYPLERDDNLKIKFDGQMAAVRRRFASYGQPGGEKGGY